MLKARNDSLLLIDEIRPTFLPYVLLDDIMDRRSFSQAGNSAHGVQNEPFRTCYLPKNNAAISRAGILGLSTRGTYIHGRLASHENLRNNPTRRALSDLWRKVVAKAL